MPEPSAQEYDSERKHLETLLSNRINFYLVFSGILFTATHAIQADSIKALTLIIGAAISFLMTLAVFRTHCLVMGALEEIKKTDNHPYAVLCKKAEICIPFNANTILLWLPIILTLFFLFNALLVLWHIKPN